MKSLFVSVFTLECVTLLAGCGGKVPLGAIDDTGGLSGAATGGGPGVATGGSSTVINSIGYWPGATGGSVSATSGVGGYAAVSTGGLPAYVGPPSPCSALLPPDVLSKRLVFDSLGSDGNRDIYTVRLDGSDLTRITTDPSHEYQPVYSPDGALLVFTSDRDGLAKIFAMNIVTGTITRLTSDTADEPSFSKNGRLLAYHSGASVYVMNADGTKPMLVGTGLDTFNTYEWPQFNADGTQLVFDRNNEVDVLNLDGSGFRYIFHNTTTTMRHPAMSPDGLDVVADVSSCGDDLNLSSLWRTPFSSTIFPCTAGLRITPRDTRSSEHAAWGRDNLLAYERVDKSTKGATLAIISTTGNGLPCTLPSFSADDRNPSWVP